MEMSFVEPEDIYDVVERMMVSLFRDVLGVTLERPFPRMSYDEAWCALCQLEHAGSVVWGEHNGARYWLLDDWA